MRAVSRATWRPPPGATSCSTSATASRSSKSSCCRGPTSTAGSCSGRPTRLLRWQHRKRVPVGPDRAEHVDHHGPISTGGGTVRHPAEDAPRSAPPEQPLLVADAEAHLTGDHHAVLLRRMGVLGHGRVRIELDDGQRDLVALDTTRANAIPDLDRFELGQGAQVGHRFLRVVIASYAPSGDRSVTTDEPVGRSRRTNISTSPAAAARPAPPNTSRLNQRIAIGLNRSGANTSKARTEPMPPTTASASPTRNAQ